MAKLTAQQPNSAKLYDHSLRLICQRSSRQIRRSGVSVSIFHPKLRPNILVRFQLIIPLSFQMIRDPLVLHYLLVDVQQRVALFDEQFEVILTLETLFIVCRTEDIVADVDVQRDSQRVRRVRSEDR